MFMRYFTIFAAVLVLGACSSSGNKGSVDVDGAGTIDIANDGFDDGSIYGDPLETDGPNPGSQADLVVNVGDRVFFETDSSDLTLSARTTLENQARWLQQYPNLMITVEGHADERGTREYNLALGERRANVARNYLITLGVPSSRITTISFGKERPAVPGSNSSSWAQNRRSVTKVR